MPSTSTMSSKKHETRIPLSEETRSLVKSCKRGGEAYDTLLRKMVKQYDPEKASRTARQKN